VEQSTLFVAQIVTQQRVGRLIDRLDSPPKRTRVRVQVREGVNALTLYSRLQPRTALLFVPPSLFPSLPPSLPPSPKRFLDFLCSLHSFSTLPFIRLHFASLPLLISITACHSIHYPHHHLGSRINHFIPFFHFEHSKANELHKETPDKDILLKNIIFYLYYYFLNPSLFTCSPFALSTVSNRGLCAGKHCFRPSSARGPSQQQFKQL